jgi:hypothetical protein
MEYVLPIAVGLLVLLDVVTRKKRNIRALLAFVGEKGWEMMLIDRCLSPKLIRRRSSMTYIARYGTKDGDVHEAILEVGWLGDVSLLEHEQLPHRLVRQMADTKLQMDCRQCGTHIQAGLDRCPYCSSWRNAFNPG